MGLVPCKTGPQDDSSSFCHFKLQRKATAWNTNDFLFEYTQMSIYISKSTDDRPKKWSHLSLA